ncbi:unnamed protein product [Orchesella dallaii]|uniref:Metalloendopeptidase n=1 Tax=Orchesella dallaii TaxID=48710 RepID=A0ABP1RID0_9HEXA
MFSGTFLSDLFPISALLISILSLGNGYNFSCVIEPSDPQDANSTQRNIYPGNLWPNGVVTYRLHDSIRENCDHDIEKAYLAMQEISSKTCIKFKAWEAGDKNFVDLMVDHKECGLAHVCMIGGRQWVKFGGKCRTLETMVHELMHTLCFRHEHWRPDRNKYLNFMGCHQEPEILEENKKYPLGIYDYGSQVHYKCIPCHGGSPTMPGVTKCGSQVTSGLSIIDADKINALYNCQGCNRHRWRLIKHPNEDVPNMYSFGHKNNVGYISPCRALINGEISVGFYYSTNKTCSFSFGDAAVYEFTHNFEVLTFPGGISQPGATYKWVDREEVESAKIIKAALPAGREGEIGNSQTMYIAYVSVDKYQSIGKVAVRNGELQKAVFVFEREVYHAPTRYYVLTCE